MSQKALLLSIHSRFAEMIFSGTKTIELRRRRPRVNTGDLVFVYVPTPVRALIGAFEVGRTIEGPPKSIWKNWSSATGLTQAAFDRYFFGRKLAYGIVIKKYWRLDESVGLETLRKRKRGFHPPQAFHYLPLGQLAALGSLCIDSLRSGMRPLQVRAK